jgi:hypothetical protein
VHKSRATQPTASEDIGCRMRSLSARKLIEFCAQSRCQDSCLSMAALKQSLQSITFALHARTTSFEIPLSTTTVDGRPPKVLTAA